MPSRAAARDMPGSGAAEREREREGRRLAYDDSAWTLLLAAVPRRKRSRRGPASSRWWREFRRPVPVPPPQAAKEPVARKAARAGRCVDCGATETPQWRAGPTGPGTLCNGCGIRCRAAGERWGQRRRPWRATARTVVSDHQPPPQVGQPIPDLESPPDGQICEKGLAPAPAPDRVTSPPPATESLPAPRTARTDPDSEQQPSKKKKKKKKKPAKKKTSPDKLCDHCASSSTPKWLCNACGVRYSQGRLLPEYRRQLKNKQQPPPPAALSQPVDDSQSVDLMLLPRPGEYLASDLRVGDIDDDSGDAAANPTDKPGSLQLDPFLLEGPAAPMIVDEEEEEPF